MFTSNLVDRTHSFRSLGFHKYSYYIHINTHLRNEHQTLYNTFAFSFLTYTYLYEDIF